MTALTALALAAASVASVQAAEIIIDHFDLPAGAETAFPGSPTTELGVGDLPADREISSTGTSPTSVFAMVAGGNFSLNSGGGHSGTASASYTIASADLSATSGLRLETLDNGPEGVVGLALSVSGGWGTKTWTGSRPINFIGDVFVPWGSFLASGVTPVELGDIDNITVTLSGIADADAFLLGLVAVPEASEYAMMGALGLVGFAAFRRFKKA